MLHIYKASAGSGKTYTLTLEYIKLLLGYRDEQGRYRLYRKSDAQHRRILAVTFTNNATEELKHRIVHKFTVDDLTYLQRGGRISKTAAVIGGMIQLKPVLHVDTEGRLAAESKVRGRKKALNQLLAEMDICTGGYADKQDVVLICHADCPEDAEYVRAKVEEKYHPNKIIMSEVGPIVGAHVGPGTMVLIFEGDKR